MHPLAFTALFATFLLASLALKLWLATRQMRHVARHRGQVPAAFQGVVSLATHQRAADYTLAKGRFGLVQIAWSTLLLLGWTLLGGLEVLNQFLAIQVGDALGPVAHQLLLLAAFALLSALLEAPLDAWHTFRLEQAHGFNRMSLGLWLGDQLKGLAVGAVFGGAIAALILWLMGAAGPAWWLWAWGAWMGFNLLILVLYPGVIAPLFNRFEPLQDEAVKRRVQALMARCGFSAQGLYVMDGSRRSAHANAYFTGFGAAKRVVFFDTLLGKLSGPELEAVLAHELGHFKHRHVPKRILGMFALSGLGFALLGWLGQQAWFYTGLGVTPQLALPNDGLALLLFLLVGPVFSFFLGPVFAALSRRDEYQADAYAVAQTDAADLRAALLKLIEDNAATLTPDRLYAAFYYSHPPAAERLAALQALGATPQPAPAA